MTRRFWIEARELLWVLVGCAMLAAPFFALLAFLVWAVTP